MAKILRILNRFNLGGPTYNASYLTRYLSNEHQTLLIGGQKEDDEDSSDFIMQSLGVEWLEIPEMRREIHPKNDLIAYRKIKEIIKAFNPDIVHTHAAKAGMLGRRAATSMGVPIIVHTFHGHVFHSYFNALKTAAFIQIERALAKRSTCIIAISNIQKHELCDNYNIAPPEKVEVVPLGFDLSRFNNNNEEKRVQFRERFGIKDDTVAIGIVGRIAPVKNHKLFIDSIKYLKDNSKTKFKAFIVGDGKDRADLETYAKNLGLSVSDKSSFANSADIIFTSWIRSVDQVYAGIDLVAQTSLNEGTPVSLIEAQAAKRAVISTNVGGVKDVICENSGCIIDLANVGEFYEKMQMLLENNGLRNEMGTYGYEHVNKTYNVQRMVSDTAMLYDKLLKNKTPVSKPLFFLF